MKNLILIPLFILCLVRCATAVPILNSYPSAMATIYLDFDGQTVTGTYWNTSSLQTLVCEPATMSDAQITEIFNRVAEDYRPFNVNITTDESVFVSAPLNRRIRVIITPSSWKPGVGGIAYVGSFTWGDDTPCFVFSDRLANSPKFIAECCSHESGHTMGLSHQATYNSSCQLIESYAFGTGTGEAGWAPIMGNSYYKNMTGWFNGPSPYGCNTIQDDLNIITSQNGFTYRNDDYADLPGNSAANLGSGSFSVSGIIATNTDKDAFRFNVSQSAQWHFEVAPFGLNTANSGANLDILLELYNSSGVLIKTYDSLTSLRISADTVLALGTYYLVVSGTGNANVSDYGSLGSYNLVGQKGRLAQVITVTETHTDPLCHGLTTGTATISSIDGTPPYMGTGTFTGLAAGTYTFNVTDATGATGAVVVNINQPDPLILTTAINHVSCNGGSDGSVEISATGGTGSYSGTGIFTGLTAGIYNYTVTDANGCSDSVSVIINEPDSLILSSTISDVSCYGRADGSAEISASGGTGPYSGTGIFTGLTTGSYNYTVTDANGCSKEISVIINQPPSTHTIAENIFQQDTVSTCGSSFTLAADSGYNSYSWNTGAGTQSINIMSTGWYYCTVTNDYCSTTDSVFVSLVNANIIQNDTAICAGSAIILSAADNNPGSSLMPSNLRNGLVAYWPFNGSANDESGNGNHGSFSGLSCETCSMVTAPPLLTSDRLSYPNAAYEFSNNLDFISIPNRSTLQVTNNFSISMWVNPNQGIYGQGPAYISILQKWGGTGSGASYMVALSLDGKPILYTNNSQQNSTLIGLNPIQLNKWTHLLFTFNNGYAKLYLNGSFVNSSSNLVIPAVQNSSIEIGRNFNQFANYSGDAFTGKIDDIAIWNKTLSDFEIQELFSCNPFRWSTNDTTTSITVSPSQTTIYYVTVSNGINSCIDSVNISVLPTPDAGVISGEDSACVAIPANYTGTGDPEGLWQSTDAGIASIDSNGVLNPVSVGNTTIQYIVSNNFCSDTAVKNIRVTTCLTLVNLKAFIQGYYAAANFMRPALLYSGITGYTPFDTDTITVEIHDGQTGELIAYPVKTILGHIGNASVVLPRINGNHYIVIKHRNALETWSSSPVAMGPSVSYDFTTAANKAYGDNMVHMGGGKFALWSGDVNQDGAIESSDYTMMENDVLAILFGYYATDLTGDGVVESADYTLMENNILRILFVQRPF